jgi:hypothetical protein
MEVTKWLKPSISVSRIGDSASVEAATRVNVEQASGRGKGPQFKTDATRGEGPRRLGNLSTPINVQKLQMALHAKA